MKRLIFIVIVLAMCMPVHGLTYNAADSSTFFNGYAWGGGSKDRAWQWAQDVQAEAELGGGLGRGNIRYVDSGETTSGDGTAWSRAFITLEEAFAASAANALTANNGDVVLVAQGHAETLSTAAAVDCDVAGVYVIGYGSGTDMPEFSSNATASTFIIGAANVTLYNLRFLALTNATTIGISIEAAGDQCTIVKCVWPEPATATWEFVDAIDLASGVDGFSIYNCVYRHVSTTGPAHFIEAGNGANMDMTIIGNSIAGEFSVAAIWSDTVDWWTSIGHNNISNLTASQHAIEFTGAAEGMLFYNNIYTDVSDTSIDPGSMFCIENYVVEAINKSGLLYPITD